MLFDLFDLAERLGMTVRRLASELPSIEFEQWRARERALRTLEQQSKNQAVTLATVKRARRRGR